MIVIEGAGSVSELNLRASDLVNLGLVTRLAAPWDQMIGANDLFIAAHA